MEDKALILTKKYKTILANAEINTPLRLAHFWGQLKHESNLEPKAENTMYTKKRLMEVFPKYFDVSNVDKYAFKPMAMANHVYANRMGNGNEGSGDGFKYRGRGHIQITGKVNYTALSDATGIDYVKDPDKLLNESDSLIAALWFWTSRNLNELADADDVKGVTKKINGGYNGLSDRKKWVSFYKEIFKEDEDEEHRG